MVRSVATPRVSNHEAPWMRGHDSTQPENGLVYAGANPKAASKRLT